MNIVKDSSNMRKSVFNQKIKSSFNKHQFLSKPVASHYAPDPR